MQWVRAQGLTWDEIVFGDEGYDLEHLDIALMYAKANVCGLAASTGRLQILQNAVEDGCKWDPARCLRGAEWKKQDHVVSLHFVLNLDALCRIDGEDPPQQALAIETDQVQVHPRAIPLLVKEGS